jgi:hypothetical protein
MAITNKTKYYFGLILLTVAIIFLIILMIQGPHAKIPRTSITIIYDAPNGPIFENMQAGDRIKLNFESNKPVNAILMRTEDSGNYFILEERTGFEYYVLADDSTGAELDHTFDSGGNWKLYFENPTPPPSSEPKVTYWGEVIIDEDYVFYYLNISVSILLIIVAIALIYSSKVLKPQPKKKSGKKSTKKG